jgi:serine/threonine protein kinase
MSEFEAKHYLAELIVAIEELHKNGIVHRDIKPENILIDLEGHIKLSDFGLAKVGVFKNNLTKTMLGGGLTYKIPEVVMQKEYGPSVDIYLFGLLTYEMLLGVPAFPCPESEEE